MVRIITVGLVIFGCTAVAFGGTVSSPEIDASSAAGAVALLGGAVLILRGRRRAR